MWHWHCTPLLIVDHNFKEMEPTTYHEINMPQLPIKFLIVLIILLFFHCWNIHHQELEPLFFLMKNFFLVMAIDNSRYILMKCWSNILHGMVMVKFDIIQLKFHQINLVKIGHEVQLI